MSKKNAPRKKPCKPQATFVEDLPKNPTKTENTIGFMVVGALVGFTLGYAFAYYV